MQTENHPQGGFDHFSETHTFAHEQVFNEDYKQGVHTPHWLHTVRCPYVTQDTKSCIHTGCNAKLVYKKKHPQGIFDHFSKTHTLPVSKFSRRIINKVYIPRIGYTQLDAYITKYTKSCIHTGFNTKFVCEQKKHPQGGFDHFYLWTGFH